MQTLHYLLRNLIVIMIAHRYADNVKFMKENPVVAIVRRAAFYNVNAARLKAIKGRDIIKDN